MTEVPFDSQCPSCGFKFRAGMLVVGKPLLEGCNGVCCSCGEVLRVNPDRSLRVLTCKEYLSLHPLDAFNIAMLSAQVRAGIERRKAEKKAAAN